MTTNPAASPTLLIATVALAVTDTDGDRLAVDEVRDENILATPFTVDIPGDEIEDADWDAILAEAGWTVTSAWIDHDGYWCAHVQRVDALAA